MSLEKIVSIPGMSGLYKVIAQLRNGGHVVESLTDQKRLPVDAMHRMSKLEDISVYTVEGDMPLREVFLKMKEHAEDTAKVTPKSDGAELRTAFKKIVPNFDEERVHISDIRKMLNWYGLLKDIVDFKDEVKEEVKEEKATVAEAAAVVSTSPPSEAESKDVAKPKVKTPKSKKVDTANEDDAKPSARKKTAKKSAS